MVCFQVTISPFDKYTGVTGRPRTYTVPFPATSIKFDGLTPDTIYNITVQAGTNSGYGQELWGVYSTLATGRSHILRLGDRTPTSLTVEWEPMCLGSGNNIVSADKCVNTIGRIYCRHVSHTQHKLHEKSCKYFFVSPFFF